MSDGGFLRRPGQSYASTYSSGGYGQSRTDDEPAPTPQQRDEKQARRDLMDANQLAADAKKLDQVPAAEWQAKRDQLAEKIETFAAGLKSHAGATENADHDRAAAVAAVAKARETIKHAKPPRTVPPVAGEEAIEPQIADKSIAPEDVIDWMAGLSRSERAAVWRRYRDVANGNRTDAFAVALANYVGAKRIASDLGGLASMSDREVADWRARNQPADAIGQSTPLDPAGQSRPLDPAGQSFADPARDADHDGRADLFTKPARAPLPTPTGTDRARDLAAYADGAIAAAHNLAAVVPSYVNARDALDLASLQALATEILTAYEKVRTVDAAIAPYARPVDASHPPSPEEAADRGRLLPLAGALDAAIALTDAQLAAHIGPTAFRGQPIAGASMGPLPGNPDRALRRIFDEAMRTGAVLSTVIEVRDLIPSDGALPPATARTVADAIARTATRPVHFAFVKTALSALGLWHIVESARAGDGRALTQVDQDAAAQAARFGAGVELGSFKPDQALALLRPKPDDPNYYEVTEERAIQVFKLIESVPDPLARAAIFRDLNQHHPQLVEALANTAPFAHARRAHEGLPPGGVAGGDVAMPLFHRFADKDTSNHSLSHYAGQLPGGSVINFGLNLFTGGFVGEHDAAYGQMREGEISEGDFYGAVDKAMLRAAAVAAVSYATGGAAGAYAEGLTASLAARGIAGRIAAGTITGMAAGAGGGFGSRLGNDLVDQRVSGLDEYAHDIGMGALVGGGLGAGASTVGVAGSAIARNIPDKLKTPIHWFSERFPAVADDPDLFSAIRELGVRHSRGEVTVIAKLAKVRALLREGAADADGPTLAALLGGPELAIAGGGRVRLTIEARGNLHEPGPLRTPALHIQAAERLDNFADDLADDFGSAAGRAEPSHGSLFDDYGDGANYADDVSDWHGLDSSGLDEAEDAIAGIGLAEPDGGRLGRRVRHVDDQALPDRLAGERGIGPLSDVRLGITRNPRHHVLPQEEIAFFQARGFPGREIDNFTIELPTIDHEMLHGGNQGLARVHWKQREWNTELMKRLRREEARKASQLRARLRRQGTPAKEVEALANEQGKLTRTEILDIAKNQMTDFHVDHFPFVPYTAP